MLIHSITPIEYLIEQQPLPQFECKAFAGGFLQGYQSPEGFVLSRVISTDPAAYLKEELSPGQIYKL